MQKIKYKHAWAWDTVMGSSRWYKQQIQLQAENTHAPIDCTFPGENGRWHTFEEIINQATREAVLAAVSELEDAESLRAVAGSVPAGSEGKIRDDASRGTGETESL